MYRPYLFPGRQWLAPRKLAVYSFSFGVFFCYVLVETFICLFACFFHSFILSFFMYVYIYLFIYLNVLGSIKYMISGWNCMLQTYIERCYHTL